MAKLPKTLGFLLAVLAAGVVSGCQWPGGQPRRSTVSVSAPPTSKVVFQDRQRVPIQVGTASATVEVVKTEASIVLGLSGRDEIGSDGMLFMMPTPQIQTFWMKDMKFDLDMIWLRDNQVVDISYQVPKPKPNTPLSALPLIKPKVPADMVLEVVAGQAQNWGVKVGDTLVFSSL